jgi:hypothetical protein
MTCRCFARAAGDDFENYCQIFNGILNLKQLEGLRLRVTPFAQEQFNRSK